MGRITFPSWNSLGRIYYTEDLFGKNNSRSVTRVIHHSKVLIKDKRSTDPNLTIVRYHYIYTNVQVYMVRTDVHRTQINTRYTDVHETHICTRDAHM